MLQTPLADWHKQNSGRMVDFAGWQMPIQYSTIVDEHRAVRGSAGLFDISHMGRVRVSGSEADAFLNYVTTIDVTKLQPGRIRYALATNEHGGTKDDILIYRLADHFLVVVNASNREKLLEAWQAELSNFAGTEMQDETLSTAMIAVQGPHAAAILESMSAGVDDLRYYRWREITLDGTQYFVSRTGYTGEDGFELIGPNEQIVELWGQILQAGAEFGVTPCGLGCRDTLRLEAGMPLYGHELSEELDGVSAGLQFAIDFSKTDFLGKEPLERRNSEGTQLIRVGLELEGRRIAREHAEVFNAEGETVGAVSSGTFSPTLNKAIAMAYVRPDVATIGTKLTIDIRGTKAPASVTPLPFYQRPKAK